MPRQISYTLIIAMSLTILLWSYFVKWNGETQLRRTTTYSTLTYKLYQPR